MDVGMLLLLGCHNTMFMPKQRDKLRRVRETKKKEIYEAYSQSMLLQSSVEQSSKRSDSIFSLANILYHLQSYYKGIMSLQLLKFRRIGGYDEQMKS